MLKVIRPFLSRILPGARSCQQSSYTKDTSDASSDSKEQSDTAKRINVEDVEILRASCCMSGCQNCVWLKYVDDLLTPSPAQVGSDTDAARLAQLAQIKREVEQMSDESLKAFLLMEINAKLKSNF